MAAAQVQAQEPRSIFSSAVRRGITRIPTPLVALLLFLASLAVRLYFFSGFVLGDDGEELLLVKHISHHGVDFQVYRHLEYRFAIWLFNLLSFQAFGVTEASFFLPTVIMSASLSPIGYWALRSLGYGAGGAFLASLWIATAPFEVLIGTLRANDLILAWFLALALLAFLCLGRRPATQGTLLASLLWLAFYTKLWALFLLPALGVHYLIRWGRHGEWRGLASFTVTSLALHGIAAVVWKLKMGAYLPFLSEYSATYPVEPGDLLRVFQAYPKLMFRGSEFGTTLFGIVPYLLILLLTIKIVSALATRERTSRPLLDRADVALLTYYGSFFLLLNFLPMNFVFDRYYSVPRIFRYMTPLSFPMVLHTAKLLLELTSPWTGRPLPRRVLVGLCSALIVLNLAQAADATRPGRTYRRALLAIAGEVARDCPPELLAELRVGIILKNVHLEQACPGIPVSPYPPDHSAAGYESWLVEHEPGLPDGAMLITGLASYVHYGCHWCGFRLEQFRKPLGDPWDLVGEYGELDYLPVPEPARLWRLSRPPDGPEDRLTGR